MTTITPAAYVAETFVVKVKMTRGAPLDDADETDAGADALGVRLDVAPTLSVVGGVVLAVEESEAMLDPLSKPEGVCEGVTDAARVPDGEAEDVSGASSVKDGVCVDEIDAERHWESEPLGKSVAKGEVEADVVGEPLSVPLDVGEGVAAAVPVPFEF
jgi:hypothetical protein